MIAQTLRKASHAMQLPVLKCVLTWFSLAEGMFGHIRMSRFVLRLANRMRLRLPAWLAQELGSDIALLKHHHCIPVSQIWERV